MATLIVPCAGRSTRYPNMRPKWLLTHPDGRIMVDKAISGLPLENYDRIIITIVKEHSLKYDAATILKQAFAGLKKMEILELDDFTSCQAETVMRTLVDKKVSGPFLVKDSDNYVNVRIDKEQSPDIVVGLDINAHNNEIFRLKSKSFLKVNEQGIITDIIEKKIVSEKICLGVYGFSEPSKFLEAYEVLSEGGEGNTEIYLSHVISYLIGSGLAIYKYIEAQQFEDWGTLQDWRNVLNKKASYFIDIDGIMLENRGRYGIKNWSTETTIIEENFAAVKRLYDAGAQIIFVTCRTEEYLSSFKKMLEEKGIVAHAFITGCNHSPRYLINDFAPSNPYPSCQAISLPRNGSLSAYLQNL